MTKDTRLKLIKSLLKKRKLNDNDKHVLGDLYDFDPEIIEDISKDPVKASRAYTISTYFMVDTEE